MPRRKSADIAARIIKAERLRLRSLRQNPVFQTDHQKLEQIAKNLPPAPLIPVSELTENNWRLSRPAEKKYLEWEKAANAFSGRWGFKPRLTDDGGVTLSIRSPVSLNVSPETGSVTGLRLNTRHHAMGDAVALAKRYQSLRGTKKKKRRHLDVDELRIKAREAHAVGKSLRAIAKALFPGEYRTALATDPRVKLKRLTERVRYLLKHRQK